VKYDARTDVENTQREAFLGWLTRSTVEDLKRCGEDKEKLGTAVFLFLNRAYEAHLDADLIVDLLGAKPGSILDAAELSSTAEAFVLDQYELLDPTICSVYE